VSSLQLSLRRRLHSDVTNLCMWYDEQRGADAARGGAHGSLAGNGLRLASQQYAEAAPSAVARMAGGAAGAELGSSKSPLYVTQVAALAS
jgi:hypothetical protein